MGRIFQHDYGFRSRSNWGQGEYLAPWRVGDVIWVPADCKAVVGGRCETPGLNVIISAFSVDEGPGWYFRVSPLELRRPRYSYTARVNDGWVSDRLHVFQEGATAPPVDWTDGFVLVYAAQEPPDA